MVAKSDPGAAVPARPWLKLSVLGGVTALVALAVYFSLPLPGQGRGGAEDPLAVASAARGKGDFEQAIRSLQAAAADAPEDADIRRRLGSAFLDAGRARAAEIQLRKALEFGAAEDAVHEPLVRSLLLQGRYQEIVEWPESEPGDADITAYQGHAYVALGQAESAAARYTEAMRIEPGNRHARLGMAGLAMSRGDLGDVRTHLVALTTESPDFAAGWLAFGALEQREEHPELAIAAYERAINLPGDQMSSQAARLRRAQMRIEAKEYDQARVDLEFLDKQGFEGPDVQLGLAQIALLTGDLERAKDLTGRLLADHPGAERAWFLGGLIAYLDGRPERAEELLRKFHARNNWSLDSAIMLSDISLKRGDSAAARNVLLATLRANPSNAQTYGPYARSLLAEGRVEEAIEILEKRLELEPQSVLANLDLGNVMQVSGRSDTALRVFQRTAEANPTDPAALVSLFQALLNQGRNQEALDLAKRIYEEDPENVSALAMLGLGYAAVGDLAPARDALERVLAINPEHLTASRALLQVALQEGKHDEARSIRNRILEAHPDDIPSLLSRADEEFRAGDVDKSLATFRAIVAANPTDLRGLIGLAALQSRTGDDAAAIVTLQRAVSHHPRNRVARMTLSQHFSRLGRHREAADTLRPLIEDGTDDPALLRAAGSAFTNAGDGAAAVSMFDRLVEIEPASAEAHYLRAKALALTGNAQAVDKALATAREIDPDYFPAQLASVRRQLASGRLTDAAALVRKMEAAHGDNPEVMLLAGDVSLAQGRTDDAVAKYEGLLDASPSRISVARLAGAHARAGNMDAMQSVLENWLKKHPDDASIRVSLAEAHTRRGKREQAVKEYKAALDSDPDNVIALNNLALLQHELGSPESLQHARKALTLAPESPGILDTAGWIMVETGQVAQGVTLLEKAVRLAPNSTTLRFHYALGLIANGQIAQGKRELETLLARKDDFAERARAQMTMQQLQ